MKTKRTAASLASALIFGLAPAAQAQSCSGGSCRVASVVSVHVGTVLRLELDRAPVVAVSLGAAKAVAFQPVTGPQATVRSNGRWRLEISAAAETWDGAEAGARLDKPAADLQWKTEATGDFAALSTQPAVAATGSTTPGVRVPVLYRARIAPAGDVPGTYTMVVRYTLTSS
jgi:hypothetical protein